MKNEENIQSLLNKKFKSVKDITILFAIDFPILFCFEADNQTYLSYTLEYRYRKKMAQLLIVPSSKSSILELLSQKRSLRTALIENDSFTKWYVDFSNEVDSQNNTLILQKKTAMELQGELPTDNFLLSHDLPNQIDLAKAYQDLSDKWGSQLTSSFE